MPYNAEREHRHSIRLPGWDYAHAGWYFVTIVTQDRLCLFDDPVFRHVVETFWQAIPRHDSQASLDAWVLMPNHLHAIILLQEDEAAPDCDLAGPAAYRASNPRHPVQAGKLGAIIGAFKAASARRINQIRRCPGISVWQRGYYEHIIRSDRELEAVRRYIADNPAAWADDPENLQRFPAP